MGHWGRLDSVCCGGVCRKVTYKSKCTLVEMYYDINSGFYLGVTCGCRSLHTHTPVDHYTVKGNGLCTHWAKLEPTINGPVVGITLEISGLQISLLSRSARTYI